MRGDAREPDLPSLAAYLEGELSLSEAQSIEAAVAGSTALQAELEGLGQIRRALASVDEEVAGQDLVPRLRRALASSPSPLPMPKKRRWRLAAASTAAAGLLVALAVAVGPHLRPAGLRVKGGAGVNDEAWVGLHVLRTRPSGPVARVERELAADDALVFAYSNAGPRPFSHLMIFAVDDGGEVYWYHPSHQEAGADPSSLPIEPRADVELTEAVRHRLRQGPLALYALFTRAPLGVREVERMFQQLRRAGSWTALAPARLPIPDSALKILRLKVSP